MLSPSRRTSDQESSTPGVLFYVASLLFLLCSISVTQQVRSILFWRHGYPRFSQIGNFIDSKRFGGHTISVEDVAPRTHDYSDTIESGTATIRVDGAKWAVVGPLPIHVGQDGLVRYPRWISIFEIADGVTGETSMYIGSRIDSVSHHSTFDITQISESGQVDRSLLSFAERAESFPKFLIVHELSDTSIEPYSFSFFPMPGELVPYAIPWLGLVISALLAWRLRPSRRKIRL